MTSHIIESEIRLFADDCVSYREIKKEDDTLKLQRDMIGYEVVQVNVV